MNVKARVLGLPGKPVDPAKAAAWLKKLAEGQAARARDNRDAVLEAAQRAEELRKVVLFRVNSA